MSPPEKVRGGCTARSRALWALRLEVKGGCAGSSAEKAVRKREGRAGKYKKVKLSAAIHNYGNVYQ